MKKRVVLFLFIFMCFSCSGAQATSLYIRSNKSYVVPGSSYVLTVFSSLVPFTGYTGLLDVNVTSCNQSGSCNNTTGPWGSYQVSGGSVKIDIAANFAPSYFRASFKPRNSNWDWSNEIQINIGMVQGLENAQDYWLLSAPPTKFVSTNFVDKKDSETLVGFRSPTLLCGETVQSMYFMKSDPSGYWDPHNPWYDTIRAPGYDELNLMWHIVPWQKKAGWEDEYLTVAGHEIYKSNFSDPFNMATNFQEKTGQYRNKFPNYILSAKWIGAGWSSGGRVESYQAGPSDSFCNISTVGSGRPGTWAVHADIVKLSLPKYDGPALRYRFYEGGENFVTDATKWGLREDWYFVKNRGLVKIEAKYFGPNVGVMPCQQDTDCLINEIMVSPQIRLVRGDLLAPTSTAVPTTMPTNTPVPTNTPIPPTPTTKAAIVGDYDGNGVVALGDFGEWKKRYLAVPPTMTLADFGVWKKAYLNN